MHTKRVGNGPFSVYGGFGMVDIAIVGAGPAGLTAAVYARRAGKSVLVLEKETFGGQVTFSPKIENFPGSPAISGNELADKLLDQAMNMGADVEMEEVTAIRPGEGCQTVVCGDKTFEAKSVILAVGVRHRRLGVAREDELTGSGVSYCAVCDGAFYKGQSVGVVGGGNSALQEAVLLADTCSEVTVLQNLAFLTGEAALIERLKAKPNVHFLYEVTVDALVGDDALTGVVLNTPQGKQELALNGLFVAIGLEPKLAPFADVAALTDRGYFDADEQCLTKTPGVFVAGDCRSKAIRQITTAAADGAVAALAAVRWLDENP